MLAGLPYVVWPIGSVFILASRKKEDPFLHYHAVQGLLTGAVMSVLSIIAFVLMVVIFRIMPGTSTLVPGILGMVMLFGGGAIAMVVLLTAVFLGWRATAGEMLRLPYLGDYAEEKMLEHTGMTRRAFVSMLEESLIEPDPDEDGPIPFPESQTARQRVESQRLSRDPVERGATRAQPQPQPSAPSRQNPPTRHATPARTAADLPRRSSEPRPVQLVKESNVSRPPAAAQVPPPASREPSRIPPAPRVKDVDLIRHYKERQGTSKPSTPQQPAAQSEVLRKWLSSVDTDS